MKFEHIYFSRRSLGYRTLMAAGLTCLLLGGSLSQADTVGYWRFGDDPNGFLADSGTKGLDLRQLDSNDVPAGFDPDDQADATQVAIPGSGPGSTFDDAIAGNAQMAEYAPGRNRMSGFVVDDAPALTVSDFTIEALIHRADEDPDSAVEWNIAGQYSSPTVDFLPPAGKSWKLVVRDGENQSDFGQLKLAISSDGSNIVGVASAGITLDQDKDYYIALSFDLSNQTDGLTFYAKDLGSSDPMQIDKQGHTLTSLFDASGPFWIGTGWNPHSWQGEGLVDEVRYSDVVLDPSELLVPTVLGDFDGDDDVDGADFLKWQRDLGDATNLTLWQDNFGTTAAVPAVAPVPEPASWALLCTMALAASSWRRRS